MEKVLIKNKSLENNFKNKFSIENLFFVFVNKMSTTHVYFADVPQAAAKQQQHKQEQEEKDDEEEGGHSNVYGSSDDAIRQCRSISPNCSSNSPIPRYERNMGFFRQLSRRFGLRSNDDLVFNSHNSNEDDTQSSSTDSCSSSAAAIAAANNNKMHNKQREPTSNGGSGSTVTDYVSCASSETSSTVDIDEQLHQIQRAQAQTEKENKCHQEQDNNDSDDITDDTARATFNKERKSFARSSFSRLHRRSTTSIRRAFEAFSLSSRSLSCSGATPPPSLPTSSASSSTNNGTPIKSSLKSSSNLELDKKSQTTLSTQSNKKPTASSCSSSTCNAAVKTSAISSKTKTKPPPQRILRQPVSYTYLKGISGLPTQRVPRNSVCCQYARR